jgi:hypothetical protein
MSRQRALSLVSLASVMAAVGAPIEAELAPDARFRDLRRERLARERELEEQDRREEAARAWVKPPTERPASTWCPAEGSCADLECRVHGKQLRKRARRAARAAPKAPAPEPRSITMPAGSLPGVLGEVTLREEIR